MEIKGKRLFSKRNVGLAGQALHLRIKLFTFGTRSDGKKWCSESIHSQNRRVQNQHQLNEIESYETKATREFRCTGKSAHLRSEEHTSELQSRGHIVCRLLLEKKQTIIP